MDTDKIQPAKQATATSENPQTPTNSDGEKRASDELETHTGSDGEKRASDELENHTGSEGEKRASEELENHTGSDGTERAMAASGDLGVRRRRGAGAGGSKSAPTVVVRHENPFFFWLAFISAISFIMVFFMVTTRLLNGSHSIELLAMPARVRAHFEVGKLVKVEVGEESAPVKAFVRGSASRGETALLLSGIGASSLLYRSVIALLAERGIAAVAVDLPGAGLAEKSRECEEEPELGFVGLRLAALKELLVEGFGPPAEESDFLVKLRSGRGRRKEALALSARELSGAVDQVVASLELAPVHLVAHDTAVEAALAWAVRNPAKVASVTLVDTDPRSPSLPVWLLRVPVLGALIANSDLALRWILRSCCFASVTAEGAEDHGYLLRSNGGLQALLGTVAASNSSMDVAEWAGHPSLESVPKQILWASGWSKEWQREGEQLAASLPGASFHSHHGSRWPQEDAAPEIADMIAEFVKSVPSHRTDDEYSRSRESDGHHHRHHSHEHELGYMEGLGQAPGVGHGGWVL